MKRYLFPWFSSLWTKDQSLAFNCLQVFCILGLFLFFHVLPFAFLLDLVLIHYAPPIFFIKKGRNHTSWPAKLTYFLFNQEILLQPEVLMIQIHLPDFMQPNKPNETTLFLPSPFNMFIFVLKPAALNSSPEQFILFIWCLCSGFSYILLRTCLILTRLLHLFICFSRHIATIWWCFLIQPCLFFIIIRRLVYHWSAELACNWFYIVFLYQLTLKFYSV